MGDASREILRQARKQIPQWSATQVHDAFEQKQESGAEDQDFVLVDVREKHEWNEGYIPGAIHVPRGFLELQIEEAVPDKSKTVVLYCAGGVRSLIAGVTLQQMGYKIPFRCLAVLDNGRAMGIQFVQPRTMSAGAIQTL